MRVLVTGASGFSGSHLVEDLVAKGDEVHCLLHSPAPSEQQYLRAVEQSITIHIGDIRHAEGLRDTVSAIRPNRVYHLAGLSSVRRSLTDEETTYTVNVLGTANLLNAVRAGAADAKILVVGSAEQYGCSGNVSGRLDEQTPQYPLTPYGASKAAAELVALQQVRAHGLHVVCVRLFNLAGPRQSPDFVCSDWAKQLAEVRGGMRPPRIATGNLQVTRDLSDVRDVTRLYRPLLERGAAGETVNLCSGKGTTTRHVLDTLLAVAGLTGKVEVEQAPSRIRRVEVPSLVGDPSYVEQLLGKEHSPATPLETTLKDTLLWWEKRLESGDEIPTGVPA